MSTFNYDRELAKLGEAVVLVVGDLMLDDFVYGDVSRISPEAPAPVIAVRRTEQDVGGAGNVARNIASLGARAIFVGLIGDDEAGRILISALQADPRIEPALVIDPARPTTRKVRFVSEHFSTHLLRADWEEAKAADPEREDDLIARALAILPRAGAVVLSDYAKGVLTPRVIRAVIDAARQAGKPVIVDPKASDYAIYRGATLIKPNRKELADATRLRAGTQDEIVAAAAELNRLIGTTGVLVSLSDEGIAYVPADGAPIHVPAYPVKVVDASGAGDTVVAVLAAMFAVDADRNSPSAPPMPPARWWSASRAPRLCRLPNCAAAFSRPPRSRRKRRSSSTGRSSTGACANGVAWACGSASPMAASTCCIPATSRCWRARARPATGWWSASTATPRSKAKGRGPPNSGRACPRRGARRARGGRSGGDLRGRHAVESD